MDANRAAYGAPSTNAGIIVAGGAMPTRFVRVYTGGSSYGGGHIHEVDITGAPLADPPFECK